MASGESTVGVISDCEDSFVGAFECVTGVVLVEFAGARAVADRDDDDGVGGNGGGVGGEVIESGDVVRV